MTLSVRRRVNAAPMVRSRTILAATLFARFGLGSLSFFIASARSSGVTAENHARLNSSSGFTALMILMTSNAIPSPSGSASSARITLRVLVARLLSAFTYFPAPSRTTRTGLTKKSSRGSTLAQMLYSLGKS